MYRDSITLFMRKPSNGVDTWKAARLENVDLNADRGAIIRQYGANSTDTAQLHIKYTVANNQIKIGRYTYLEPKKYTQSSTDDGITLASGNNFGFFIEDEWDGSNTISDADYPDGFYNYANQRFGRCYAITSVARYSVIPHFEVLAK